MKTNEIASVATAFIVLAGLAYAIANAGGTAAILSSGSQGFSSIIRASTGK